MVKMSTLWSMRGSTEWSELLHSFCRAEMKNEFQETHFSQAHRKPFKCGLRSTQKRDHIKKAFKPLKVFLTSDFKRVPSQNCTRSSCLLIIWSGMREIQLISPSAIQWSMSKNVKLENYVGFLIFLCQTNGFFIFRYIYWKCRQWCAKLIWKLEVSEAMFSGFFSRDVGTN